MKTIKEYSSVKELAEDLKLKAVAIPNTRQVIINEFIYGLFGVKTYTELIKGEC